VEITLKGSSPKNDYFPRDVGVKGFPTTYHSWKSVWRAYTRIRIIPNGMIRSDIRHFMYVHQPWVSVVVGNLGGVRDTRLY